MKTARQELIDSAAIRARRYSYIGYRQAHMAIEEIVSECQNCAPGTVGAQIVKYYRSASERAIDRLIYAVWKCEWNK